MPMPRCASLYAMSVARGWSIRDESLVLLAERIVDVGDLERLGALSRLVGL